MTKDEVFIDQVT